MTPNFILVYLTHNRPQNTYTVDSTSEGNAGAYTCLAKVSSYVSVESDRHIITLGGLNCSTHRNVWTLHWGRAYNNLYILVFAQADAFYIYTSTVQFVKYMRYINLYFCAVYTFSQAYYGLWISSEQKIVFVFDIPSAI